MKPTLFSQESVLLERKKNNPLFTNLKYQAWKDLHMDFAVEE